MGPAPDPEPIRLTVPAQADFVALLRVTARVVAGRVGFADDARSRLQAAVGDAFFTMLEGAEATSSIVATLHAASGTVTVELTGDRAPVHHDEIPTLGDGHELRDGGST
ncbi:MAG: hypothetical protein ABWZ76_05450, partial [Acidimicrobiales bacterium]